MNWEKTPQEGWSLKTAVTHHSWQTLFCRLLTLAQQTTSGLMAAREHSAPQLETNVGRLSTGLIDASQLFSRRWQSWMWRERTQQALVFKPSASLVLGTTRSQSISVLKLTTAPIDALSCTAYCGSPWFVPLVHDRWCANNSLSCHQLISQYPWLQRMRINGPKLVGYISRGRSSVWQSCCQYPSKNFMQPFRKEDEKS